MTYEQILAHLAADAITPQHFYEHYRRGTTSTGDGLAPWIGPMLTLKDREEEEWHQLVYHLVAHDVYLVLRVGLETIKLPVWQALPEAERDAWDDWDGEGTMYRWVADKAGFRQVWPHEVVIRQTHYRTTPPDSV